MARSTWHRWLPAGAVVALVAGTVTVTSQAGAVDLPDKSPQDVLTLLLEQDVTAYSGSFETSADLGLPVPADVDLGPGGPGMEDAAGAVSPEGGEDAQEVLSALELLTGDNTGRVFVGEQGARFQHTDGLAERNVVVTAGDVWFYDSEANAATHLVLPEGHEGGDHPEPTGTLPTPEELAATAVEALEPSTELSVGQHERVAGRDAYTLTLTPRAEESLVTGVTITVDGETGFPLGVAVLARDHTEPVLQARYTDIDFAAPDPALFDFTAPAGATVEEEVLERPEPGAHAAPEHLTGATLPGEVVGEGWGAVLVVPDVDVPAGSLLEQLTDPVDGGRLLPSTVLPMFFTDDGRLLVGAVNPSHLQDVAAGR